MAEYQETGQAEAQIILTDIQVYAQTNSQILTTYYAVGNSLSQILVQDNQAYSQALAWIALTEYTEIFVDTFTRTTTAPPFNVGTSDSGHTWYWTNDDSSYGPDGSTSPTHVENGMLVGPTDATYDSMAGFPHITYGEFWIDFWMPAADDNDFEWYWYDLGWYVGIDAYSNSNITLEGRTTSPTIAITARSAWYRVHAVIDLSATDKVRAAVWKVGDSEPSLQTIQTTNVSYDSYFDIFYAPAYETAKFDNIIIKAFGPMPFNLGRGQAQAQILATNQTYSQTQAILNQSLYVGQSLASIVASYQKYSQAQAKILKSAGYANAQTKIAWPTDSYRDLVYADGATHFYGMHTANAYPNNDYRYFKDELGTKDSYYYYYDTSSVTVVSPIGPEYLGISLGHYLAYRGWTSENTTYIPEFTTSNWSYDAWVKAPSASPALATIFGLYLQSSFHYFDIYFGSTTSGNSTGTKIVAIANNSGDTFTYYDTGITFVPNAWYHIAVTYNNKVFKVYINSVLTNTITRPNWNPTGTTNYFYIHNSVYFGTGTSYVGGYDGLAIYPITLSPEIITNHYIEGPNTQFVYAQTQAKLNSFNWNEYGQTQAILNQSMYVAQAEAKLNSFNWNEYGQAQAKLNSFDYPQHAQALSMIIPYNGMLKYFIQGNSGNWSGLPDNATPSQITTISADTDITQINLGSLGSYYGIRWQAWFTADWTGSWYFKTYSDDGSALYIYNEQNQLVGSIANGYPGGQSGTTKDGYISLVAGTKYKIDVKYGQGGGGAIIQAWYRRPTDTVDNWLLGGYAPWNTKDTKYWGIGIANSWTVYRGPGGEYIWPQYAQAQTRMVYTGLTKYAQAMVQIGPIRPAQAIAQILNETDNYRLAVLADDPLVYYPLDETSYGSGILNSIVGRRNAVWSGSTGLIFGQPGALLSGTSIYFGNNKALDSGQNMRNGIPSTIPLTIPGYQGQENNMNVISPTWWGVAGDVVTINIGTPPGSADIGIYQIGGENQWWSKNGYQTTGGLVGTGGTSVPFTLTSTGPHFVYLWTYSAGYTGTGTVTINSGGIIAPESAIPMDVGAPITVETWIKWDGTTDYRMILGFDNYNFSIKPTDASNANLTVEVPNNQWYGTTNNPIKVNTWYHVAAVMYNRQAFSTNTRIYVNGVQQTLSGGSPSASGFFQPYFNIGGWSTNTSYRVYSTLDEFAIYNYALTTEQILAHYKARIILWNAQAQAKLNSFGYPQWAQAQAYMKGLEFAQAIAHIKAYPYKSAQATSLITVNGEGFVRMIWSGEYTPYPENITSWAVEDGANQIYYNSGTGMPGYPGSNAGAGWSARFVADTTGTWQFRTQSDDNSELFINSTIVISNYATSFYEGGHGNTTEDGSIALTQGQEYNLHVRWTQGGGPWNIYVYYKRPTDSDWILLTNGSPPWLFAAKVRVFAQARVVMAEQPHKYEYAQAQARILAFKVKAYSQAQGQILQTYQKYAQAALQIGHWQYGISGTRILRQYEVYAQAQFWYLPPTWHGIAQARLYAYNVPRSGNAQAKLRAFGVTRYGQAQAIILRVAVGQTLSQIKQTYPLFYLNNYASSALGATASCNEDYVIFDPTDPNNGMPINVIDHNTATLWTSYVNPAPDPEVPSDWTHVTIDLGVARTITGYYIVPHKYNATVNLQYSTNGSNWNDVITNIYFPVNIFTPLSDSNAIKGFISPRLARYWRLLVTNGGDDDQISLATFHLGVASIQSGTFGQASFLLNHRFGIGQAMVYISPSFDQNVYGQSNSRILQTLIESAQAEVWMIPPTQWSQAQAMLVSTYTRYAQSNVWMIPPTQWLQAQAKINAYNVNVHGRARTWIIGKYSKLSQAQTKITKPIAHGMAFATIFQTGIKRTAYSMAYIGHFQYAQAQVWILNGYHANAGAIIKTDYNRRSANAIAMIQRFDQWAHSQASIVQVYSKYGQAGAIINQAMAVGAAQVRIATIYNKYAGSMARILQSYPSHAQADAWILIKPPMSGQAEAFIVKTFTKSAQAIVQIGGFQYGQAQVRTLAFNVPKFAQAACYILANINVLPPTPTSNYATYLVQYNGQTLPGYAQSETFDSIQNVAAHYAAYMNGSLSEYLGLENKSITLTMLVWEPTYLQCKLKVQEAATILRSTKGFAKLYIQKNNRYYLAIPKSITMAKNVPSSSQTLTYDITFEAKPWIISNFTSTITLEGAGQISDGSYEPPVPPIGSTRVYSGLSQAKLLGIGSTRYALSQVSITRTEGYAQARALIIKKAGYGQAQVKTRNSYKVSGQSQARITRKMGVAQARVVIITLPGPPTSLVATPGDGKVILTWNPPSYG